MSNYSENLRYLIDCIDPNFPKASYGNGQKLHNLDISNSTYKNALAGRSCSEKTARLFAASFSTYLRQPEKRLITWQDIFSDPEELRNSFPRESFLAPVRNPAPPIKMSLFSNKLFRCYYMVRNSPYSAYMGYLKLFEKQGIYHAVMLRGVQDFNDVKEMELHCDSPEEMVRFFYKLEENFRYEKRVESLHLFEAKSHDDNGRALHQITFTKNRIKIDFSSLEPEPCYSTLFWNIRVANMMDLPSYIGGSALLVDTNDGLSGKDICAFKVGLEAVENTSNLASMFAPLNNNAPEVLEELTLSTKNGILKVDNSDDDRWFRFLQNTECRGSEQTLRAEHIPHLLEDLIRLRAEYASELENLRSCILDIRADHLSSRKEDRRNGGEERGE